MIAARGRKLGLGPEQAHRVGGRHRAVTDHGHPRGAGAARAPAAPGQSRLPGRLAGGLAGSHRRVRHRLGAARWLARDPADVGIVGAAGLRGRADRAGGVPLVHPAPQPQHAALDAFVLHALPDARRGGGGGPGAAAAGLAVGNSSLSAGAQLVAAAIFVVLAASTVAIPILAYVGAGDRLEEPLERLKAWMEANHDAMLAVILFLIGLIVLYNGIRALA